MKSLSIYLYVASFVYICMFVSTNVADYLKIIDYFCAAKILTNEKSIFFYLEDVCVLHHYSFFHDGLCQ